MKIAIATVDNNKNNKLNNYIGYINTLKKIYDIDSFIYQYNSINKKFLIDNFDYFIEDANNIEYQNVVSNEYLRPICDVKNKLLKLVYDTNDYNIIILVDCDLLTYPNIDSLESSIEKIENIPNIGCVSACGISCLKAEMIYYDIWSLIIDGKIQNHKIWLLNEIYDSMYVDSAYGGLAIYHGEIIKNIKFIPTIIEGYPCPTYPITRLGSEYISLNLGLIKQNFSILIDKNLRLYK